jgi:hypothetical protein
MPHFAGRGAVWLARMTGGHEVAGSSPVAPIFLTQADIRVCIADASPFSLLCWVFSGVRNERATELPCNVDELACLARSIIDSLIPT